jgi:uncharacterized protein YbjT (DUF2867 family)
MPVVVTGASGFIGPHAVRAFARSSPQVRAYIRRSEAAEALRRLGAKVAIGRIDDVDNLQTVMAGAHTLCHLVGGMNPSGSEGYEESIVGSLEPAIEAARRAGLRRVLYLSYPGASSDAANPYVRSKGRAEELVRSAGLEHVIIRSTLAYGPGSWWLRAFAKLARRHPAMVVGTGRQAVAPIFVEDVAAVLAAADDRERVNSGTWGLEGPDRIDADGLADTLAGRRARKVHLRPVAAARLARLFGERVSLPALELMSGDSLADAPDAAAEFGVPRTSLAEGLSRSLGEQRE